MFISPHQQTCSRKHHEVLDLKNLLALVIRFCVCITLEASSSLFVSFDSWKRQRAHDSIIPISCWLGNTTNRFFMLSICGFRQDSVRQVENWLDSRIHTTGLYFFVQSPPSLDGGLDSRSVSVFIICFLIAFQRHWCYKILERLLAHCCFQHIRRFSI
jgi:hypothetical protein